MINICFTPWAGITTVQRDVFHVVRKKKKLYIKSFLKINKQT